MMSGTKSEERKKLLEGEESEDEQLGVTGAAVDAPPKYTAQVPVQLQMEGGRMVSATIVQDPSEKHMVYIRDGGRARGPMPRDYLALSICTLVCCCWPLSVFALVKSIEVRSSYQGGRYTDSVNASQSSLFFNRLSIGFGITLLVFVVILWLSVLFLTYTQLQQMMNGPPQLMMNLPPQLMMTGPPPSQW